MSDATPPVIVVGGSIAALVTADRLAAAGRRVDLHLPIRGVAGGFLPLHIHGRSLELGARLIELSYDDDPGEPPPLADYQPGPHGHRPYLALLDAFVRDLAGDDLVAVDPPQVSIDGDRCTDYVLNGDLSGLADVLDADELASMAEEAGDCVATMGPQGVFVPGQEHERWAQTFATLGRLHTGHHFHDRLVESLAAKMLPGGTASVIGALHRKIWLPLFHPVTAWEACTGVLTYRPQRAMFTLAQGGMGAVAQRLLDRVQAAPEVTVHDVGALHGLAAGDGDEVVLLFEDGTERTASWPVLGVGADELFAAAGIEHRAERVVATMVWVDVAEADVLDLPPVLFATEPDVGVFRVTDDRADPQPGVRTLCCELDHRRADPDSWAEVTTAALHRLGVVREDAGIEVVLGASRPSFATPSHANRESFRSARDAFERQQLPAHVVGGATAFGADTFNEQLVQGLRVAEALVAAG